LEYIFYLFRNDEKKDTNQTSQTKKMKSNTLEHLQPTLLSDTAGTHRDFYYVKLELEQILGVCRSGKPLRPIFPCPMPL